MEVSAAVPACFRTCEANRVFELLTIVLCCVHPTHGFKTVGVLFFVVSLFQVVALGAHRGWAEGSVSTRTAYDTPFAQVPCPDDLRRADPNVTCVASQTIQGTITTTLAFGLFRSLSYFTSNSSEVTSNLYEQVNASTKRLIHSHVDYESAASSLVQDSYRSWAQGNAAAMGNVTAAQVSLVLGFWLSACSWIILLLALHYTASKRRSELRIKLSSSICLASSACLFICFSVWAAIPVKTLTNKCVQDDDDGVITCTQLLSATCDALLNQYPEAVCSSSGNVNKRGGVWGLVSLCWAVALMIFIFIGRLHEAVVASESTTPREPLLGDLERAGVRRMPATVIP